MKYILIAVILLSLQFAIASFPEVIQSPQSGELIKTLKVTGGASGAIAPYQKFVLFSLKLEDIKKGDAIQLATYGQVSNANKFAVMFVWYSTLAKSPTDNSGAIEVTEAKGTNITYEQHHEAFNDATNYVFEADYKVIYLNTLVYAASLSATASTQLVVDQDYGRSSVMLFRKENQLVSIKAKAQTIYNRCDLDINYYENGAEGHSLFYDKYQLREEIEDIVYEIDKILEG